MKRNLSLTGGVFALYPCLMLLPLMVTANDELASLGELLFFDRNLSHNRNQSCATCHDPDYAFIDKRRAVLGGAVSLGDDGISLGDRNAPTLSYISAVPNFRRNSPGEYIGGLFHDGRATDLAQQVIVPILDPGEMGMRDPAAVTGRLLENPDYRRQFQDQFDAEIFQRPDDAVAAVGKAIAAFEGTSFFSSFDSKYDRYLRGEYELSKEEELGRKLFFSQLWNCNACHQLRAVPDQQGETFSDYKYYNIGVPVNKDVRKANGKPAAYTDTGILQNPKVSDPALMGKIKVPTLRNVAVTGPYMHNGVFAELSTVIRFYNKYLVRNDNSRINPETGREWREAEVGGTIDLELLMQGQPIQGESMAALLAFLRILTDQRYEKFLQK